MSDGNDIIEAEQQKKKMQRVLLTAEFGTEGMLKDIFVFLFLFAGEKNLKKL